MDQLHATEEDAVIRVTVDVAYTRNGVSTKALVELLEHNVMHAIGIGALTGDTEAEVADYTVQITEVGRD